MPAMKTESNIVAAQWSTAQVNDLPDSSFAYIEPGGKKDADGKTTPRSLRHLPYKDPSGKVDLPHVRNALARLSETQGIPESEHSGIQRKLQNALKNTQADDTEDASFRAVNPIIADDNLPADGSLPKRMMLLRSGTFNTQKYGEIPLRADDLKEMYQNFKAGIGMAGDGSTGLPVDFSHESGKKAAAWIKDMEIVEKPNGQAELWSSDTEWSTAGRSAIEGKEFKMLSSDFYPRAFGEWVDAESGVVAQNVIVGAALTNRPMFTGNQPVIASETSEPGEQNTNKVIYVIASQEKEKSMKIDEIRVKAAEDVTGEEQRFLQASYAELDKDEREKFGLVEPKVEAGEEKGEKKPAVKASEVKGDEGTVSVEASELKAINDKVEKLEASELAARKSQVEAEVDKHIERGAIKADQKDKWVGLIMADEDNKVLLAGLADNPVLAKEQGSSDGDSDENGGESARNQLMAHATELMKKSKTEGKEIDIKAAYNLAKEQHPELVEASAAESKARLTASDEQFAAAGINRG